MHEFTTIAQHIDTSKGLAIASLVCALIGVFATMTLIGIIIGVPLLLVGLVIGIIVLIKKKQGKGLAIAGVVISTLVLTILTVVGVFISRVVVEVAPEVRDFMVEMEEVVENDPEIALLLDDPVFSNRLEALTKEQLIKRFEGLPDQRSFSAEAIGDIVQTALETYRTSLYELKDTYIQEQQALGSGGALEGSGT